MKAIVLYRFTAPGSELEMHSSFRWHLDWDRIDLGLRPVCHQLDDRIEAHIFTSFMVDVVMPTTDHRVVTLPRYIEPKDDIAILLYQLGLTLPEQPPPKVTSEFAEMKIREV